MFIIDIQKPGLDFKFFKFFKITQAYPKPLDSLCQILLNVPIYYMPWLTLCSSSLQTNEHMYLHVFLGFFF